MAMHATHAVALCPTGGAHSSKTTGLKVITETIQSFSDKWYSVASVEPREAELFYDNYFHLN